ncbi:MAG: histidinol-phosphate transaminase [Legionellales bacterium]
MSILNLIRAELLTAPSYIPGGEHSKARLHANELPWSPVTADAVNLNFYPQSALQLQLQKQLALRYQVALNQIVLTRGSDDGIDLITRLFLKAGQDALMQFTPTFSMYSFYVRLQQAQTIDCPLDPANGFSLSINQINKYWQPNCKIIMFCRPNNPTANLLDLELIASVCKHYANQSLVVVDEAYIEFSQAQSATTLIPQFENLVVLRTLSKACGLAGLRVGSIIAQAHVIDACKSIMAPYALSTPVMRLANQALKKNDWFLTTTQRITKTRNWLINRLQEHPIIETIYPSETNFILVKTRYAKELTAWFASHGIAVKEFPNSAQLLQHLRITVGDEQQSQSLIAALSSFSPKGLS